MDQYELVRTGHRVYGQNISELSRLTGHSRNTIKKAIRGEPWGYKERKHQPFPALGNYMATIDNWLKNDKDKPKKQRHTARRIYSRLVDEHGYKGCESTLRRYVKLAKITFGIESPQAFIPCNPESGNEAEVDWGIATAIIAGEEHRLKFFCMRSKYSGKHFVRFYRCERQQAFLDAHIHAFAFYGGIFPVLIYDNLTTSQRLRLLPPSCHHPLLSPQIHPPLPPHPPPPTFHRSSPNTRGSSRRTTTLPYSTHRSTTPYRHRGTPIRRPRCLNRTPPRRLPPPPTTP